jgi:hypothetical protein
MTSNTKAHLVSDLLSEYQKILSNHHKASLNASLNANPYGQRSDAMV